MNGPRQRVGAFSALSDHRWLAVATHSVCNGALPAQLVERSITSPKDQGSSPLSSPFSPHLRTNEGGGWGEKNDVNLQAHLPGEQIVWVQFIPR